MPLINDVLPFLALICILVASHEYGHFAVARALGIRVTNFSLGMGPELYGFVDSKKCRWSLRLLPIGGYVKFWGDKDATGMLYSIEDAEKLSPEDRRGAYHLRPPGHRALVLVAGPAANFLLGMLVLVGLYVSYGRQYTPPVIAAVFDGQPAAEAGLQAGDRILAIDGTAVDRFENVQTVVGQYPDKTLSFRVARGQPEHELTIAIRPKKTVIQSPYGLEMSVGRIGISAGGRVIEPIGIFPAIADGIFDSVDFTKATVMALGETVLGMRSAEEVGGPIRIAQISANAFKLGWPSYIFILAVLSINLGIVNLLPIPILDGGQLCVCAIEGISRRPANPTVLAFAYRSGIAIVLALVFFASWNDITMLVKQYNAPPESHAPSTDAIQPAAPKN